MPNNKPKGKKSAYNYFVKATSDDYKKKHPNEKIVLQEISQRCSEKWKQMDDKQRQFYVNQAEKDKERYEREMEDFVPDEQENRTRSGKGSTKSVKAKKDPNAPKKPLSSYFLFCNDLRAQIRSENPDLKMTEISKELGARWKEASQQVKARYEALAVKAKKQYEKDLAAYNSGRAPLSTKSPNKVGKGKAPSKSVASKKKEVVFQKEEEPEEEEESEEEESDDGQKQEDEEMDEEGSSDEESDE